MCKMKSIKMTSTITGISVPSLRGMIKKNLIPHYRKGPRLGGIMLDPEEVLDALRRPVNSKHNSPTCAA